MIPRASSVFRCDKEKNNKKTNKNILKKEGLVLLGEHQDANRLSTFFVTAYEDIGIRTSQ